ncbi:putative acetyl-CoA synthetase protein [Halorhabdus tiamatea SARL4B]|uniref:Putative acetyl-CoA synthetase protein n=1 Tax=Halorhabdus tiamatea SARL4B TaxID=1033806 RepID=F7PG53_9EURY|nr:hypothetical protein [Halorhabdus tiamatea]ERJ06283.1 putative acetyl-CoA synthetase protein [Halorhabdus tiamatea SARL4B]CCQ34664.1 conserved hypothetical protein [Halorhabdus tiamatea SARL4B]
MDATVIGDLVAPARRSDGLAYRVAGDPARSHTDDSVCTSTWKTANLLRLYGVHEGSEVGIVDAPKHPDFDPGTTPSRADGTPVPEVVFTFLGAALLGATVRFDPPRNCAVDALVGPAAWMDAYEPGAACTTIAYGGPPEDPDVVHFESEVWSETPIAPPETVEPDATVLTTGENSVDHRRLLQAAETFVDRQNLAAGDTVTPDAPLSEPGSVVGGILAPLVAGGTIQVGGEATVTIGGGGVDPESVRVGTQ